MKDQVKKIARLSAEIAKIIDMVSQLDRACVPQAFSFALRQPGGDELIISAVDDQSRTPAAFHLQRAHDVFASKIGAGIQQYRVELQDKARELTAQLSLELGPEKWADRTEVINGG